MSDRPREPAVAPDAYRRARAIFESALDWPPAERDHRLRDACGDDASLAAEVERMLRADALPHPLLDHGNMSRMDPWQRGDLVAGHYRVIDLIGRGGMGEVYRALDETLGREVALKVLRTHAEGTEWADDRLARIRREAQVLAGLSHPNIAAIYGLEALDDVHALVLELVEGPTLADRVATGSLPVDEALGLGRQVAMGLEAAHELGVVHRDLKPANLKVRPDGTVKILDFGLAKVVQPAATAGGATTASPVITSPSMIGRGILLGTAAYMSPEQAKGRQADRRSDIWAFGAVLYELLSAERAFKGVDIADTIAAVVRADVDWSRLPPSTPAAVRQLLARCLERDPLRRLRDIGEARILLEDVTRGMPELASATTEQSAPHPWLWWRVVTPILAAAAATTVVAAFWPAERAADPHVTRFVLSIPAERALLLDPQSIDLGLAPDGSQVIYKGGPRADRSRLFVYAFDQLEPQPLTSVGLPKAPIVSPDGQWVMFVEPAPGGPVVKKVSIKGGPPLEISRLDGPGRGSTWGDDDSIIAATAATTGLVRISPSGGEPVVLTRPNRKGGEGDHWFPASLPGGRSVLFTVTSLNGGLAAAYVAVLDVASGTWKTLIRNASQARYLPSGHLVYFSGGALWAVAFDLPRLAVFGTPAVVVPQVVTLPTGVAEFDIARDGTLAYVARGGAGLRTLVWVDQTGREEPIAAPPRAYSRVRVSPC
jgi:eukaryotic-like serine/threonine-protein kinase